MAARGSVALVVNKGKGKGSVDPDLEMSLYDLGMKGKGKGIGDKGKGKGIGDKGKGKGKDQHWREFLNSVGLQESDDGIVAINEDDGGTISDDDEIGLAAAWEAYKHDIWMSGHVFLDDVNE